MKSEKFDLYQVITDKIIDSLEKGIVPWHKSWKYTSGDSPFENIRGTGYSGMNILLLSIAMIENNWTSNLFLTFNQCRKLGGYVKKGEKSTLVVFWKFLKVDSKNNENDENDDRKVIPLLRYYRVFNLEQTEGIPEDKLPKKEIIENKNTPIEMAESVIKNYKNSPEIKFNSGNPAYIPSLDIYSTLFHEEVHGTGSEKRLDRKLSTQFAGESYSKEELIAEIGASFLNNHCHIDNEKIFKNSVGYVQSWLRELKNNKKLIVSAAGKAQKAVEYILRGENNEKRNVR